MTDMPNITRIKSMKELSDFTSAHKRCFVMMSMKNCEACDFAVPHLIAAAEQYRNQLWMGYLDINEVGISVNAIPVFQGFFNGYKIAELTDTGYSPESLNDLMERLWLTKKNAEKTNE